MIKLQSKQLFKTAQCFVKTWDFFKDMIFLCSQPNPNKICMWGCSRAGMSYAVSHVGCCQQPQWVIQNQQLWYRRCKFQLICADRSGPGKGLGYELCCHCTYCSFTPDLPILPHHLPALNIPDLVDFLWLPLHAGRLWPPTSILVRRTYIPLA